MEDHREEGEQGQATPARPGRLEGDNDLLAGMEHLLTDPRWRGPITRSVRRSMALEEEIDNRSQADRRAGESDMGTTRTPARAPDDPWDTTVHRTELDLEAGRGYNRGNQR